MVLLECEILMGEIRHEFHQSETTLIPELARITFADMMQFGGNQITTVAADNVTEVKITNPAGPKDSVYLKRGMSQTHGNKSGDEIIVYSWDQVKVLGEVERDRL